MMLVTQKDEGSCRRRWHYRPYICVLYAKASAKELPLDIVLVESSLRLGGKIQTLRKDGFIIERGPESFLIVKTMSMI